MVEVVICTDSQGVGENVAENKKVKSEFPESHSADDDSTWTAQGAAASAAIPAAKFDFVDNVASFHATTIKKSQERASLVSNVGPHRRALCARRDLAVRRALCKVDKVQLFASFCCNIQ